MRHPYIGIIHNASHTERYERLIKELETQGIKDYQIFPAIHDVTSVKKGINLAHKSVIEYAAMAGFDEVCVMEDDIRFTNPNSFKYFLSQKPQYFDIYLGGIYVGEVYGANEIDSWCGFHLYCVSRRFYKTFLSVPDDEHVDRMMAGLGKFYVCEPMAAIQWNGFSSNTGKCENYDSLLNGRNLYNG